MKEIKIDTQRAYIMPLGDEISSMMYHLKRFCRIMRRKNLTYDERKRYSEPCYDSAMKHLKNANELMNTLQLEYRLTMPTFDKAFWDWEYSRRLDDDGRARKH